MLTPADFAHRLQGKVISGGVSFRPPNHGPGDLSARLLLNASTRNGYRVFSFAGDDPLVLRDYVDLRCGLPQWKGRDRNRRRDTEEIALQYRVRERERLAREAKATGTAEYVARVWRGAEHDPRGTIVEKYLAEHRKLALPPEVCGHAIRFHPAGPWEGERVPMMLCAFRDLQTNAVVGLHRTRLEPTTGRKLDRKMLGRAGGAAIKVSADAEVTTGLALAEGVESALAGMAIGLTPIWATGSVGGIAAFPVLPGIEALTICAETGDSGASAAAVEQVGTRWSDGGREVLVVTPRVSGDLNDAIREVGR